MIRIFIFFTILVSTLLIILLNGVYPNAQGRVFYSLFAIFLLAERLWETFYTSKEKDVRKMGDDWTLLLTSAMYFFACILVTVEFFLSGGIHAISISILGMILYILSGCIRFLSVKTLGDQWAVHAVGESKILSGEHKLVSRGPYKYVRHPIYLSIMVEIFSIALITNAYFSLIFILIVNVPLYILRALKEQETSLERFGNEYAEYSKKVSFMNPFRNFYTKK